MRGGGGPFPREWAAEGWRSALDGPPSQGTGAGPRGRAQEGRGDMQPELRLLSNFPGDPSLSQLPPRPRVSLSRALSQNPIAKGSTHAQTHR